MCIVFLFIDNPSSCVWGANPPCQRFGYLNYQLTDSLMLGFVPQHQLTIIYSFAV
jgi:hypothetical protein